MINDVIDIKHNFKLILCVNEKNEIEIDYIHQSVNI